MRHSNVAIQGGETRYSFTQYSAGGLFCWVDHGFQSERAYRAGWSEARKEQEAEVGCRRWEEGMGLFMTLDELCTANRAALPPLTVP